MPLDKEFLPCQLAVCVGTGGVDDDAAHETWLPAAIVNAGRSSVERWPGHAPCRAHSTDSDGDAMVETGKEGLNRVRSGQVVNSQLGLFLYPSAS